MKATLWYEFIKSKALYDFHKSGNLLSLIWFIKSHLVF